MCYSFQDSGSSHSLHKTFEKVNHLIKNNEELNPLLLGHAFRLVLLAIYWTRDTEQVSNNQSHFAERNGAKHALTHCTLIVD